MANENTNSLQIYEYNRFVVSYKIRTFVSPSMVYILDFGSQYSQLIARRVRALGVVAELKPYTTPRAELRAACPIVIRVVTSSDIMTADWARLPHDFLARLSWRITNEVKGAVRVLYDITSKPPETVEWE